MKTLQTRSKTSPQGVLNIVLPIGLPNADVDVVLIVNELSVNGSGNGITHSASTTDSSDGWNAFVDQTAGAWEGEFVRPPQGEFERREPFA